MLEYILVENKMAGNAHQCVALTTKHSCTSIFISQKYGSSFCHSRTSTRGLFHYNQKTFTVQNKITRGNASLYPENVNVSPLIYVLYHAIVHSLPCHSMIATMP